MEVLALIIGLLVVAWYFGFVSSARRLADAGEAQAVRLQIKSWEQAEATTSSADLDKIKAFKDKVAGF